jgi:hypothetical protein
VIRETRGPMATSKAAKSAPLNQGGRPSVSPAKKKKHPVTVKFDDTEIELLNWASKADHDKRANYIKRMALRAAERRRQRDGDPGGAQKPQE